MTAEHPASESHRPPVPRLPPSATGPVWESLPAASAAALLVALFASTQIHLSMMDHGHEFWRLFAWQFGGLAFWVLLTPWLLRSGGRLQDRRRGWMARESVRMLAATALQLICVTGVFLVLQPYEPVSTDDLRRAFLRSLRGWWLLDVLVYCTALAIGYGLAGHRRTRRLELRQSQLDAELARARLETLRLQIQPHFLFNSLHSIAALMRRRRGSRALEMLLGLAELLRATLERSDRQRIALREELDLLRLYVDLQRARFADRLRVSYDVADEVLEQRVPTLLLQPLVENAIRHGIAPRAAPGEVRITAGAGGGRLRLTVDDDGVGLPEGFDLERDAGVGLANTRSRIERLYGGDASVEILPRGGGGTTVVVELPVDDQALLPRQEAA